MRGYGNQAPIPRTLAPRTREGEFCLRFRSMLAPPSFLGEGFGVGAKQSVSAKIITPALVCMSGSVVKSPPSALRWRVRHPD